MEELPASRILTLYGIVASESLTCSHLRASLIIFAGWETGRQVRGLERLVALANITVEKTRRRYSFRQSIDQLELCAKELLLAARS